MKCILLGTGGSGGVPLLGGADGSGEWGNCNPKNPKNRRTRVSLYVEYQGAKLLIDTSPDLREQFLRNHLKHIDAILYTHNHADHLHGVDDVRSINFLTKQPLHAYTSAYYAKEIAERFPYIFRDKPPVMTEAFYRPVIIMHTIEVMQPFTVEGFNFPIQSFYQDHGFLQSIGFRIGNMAYSVDTKGFPPESEPFLENLDVWIVDCAAYDPSPGHAYLDLTLSWIEKFKPKRTILTHLGPQMDYMILTSKLPQGVEVGYDGLTLDVETQIIT